MFQKDIFKIDEWKIIQNKFSKEDMRFCESITSLGNGYMGLRGNFEESYSDDFHKGTYIAGVWYPDKTKVGWWKNGYPEYFGKVINATDFIGIKVFIDDKQLDLAKANIKDFHKELDMKNGVLKRSFILIDDNKETKIEVIRFLSIDIKEICAIRYNVKPLNHSCKIKFIPYLDGNISNEDSNYEEKFWLETDKKISDEYGSLTMKTIKNPFSIEQFSVCTSMKTKLNKESDINTNECKSYVEQNIILEANEGEEIYLDKIISVTTSRNYSENELLDRSLDILNNAFDLGFDLLKQKHEELWNKRWELADVEIKGSIEAQQGIRFNIFHLFSTYYGEDKRLNIGPKGFTGEKYGGATYWDTEAYAIPMYLSIADSNISKNLLLYRYNQLDNAFVNAKKQGLEGALYPMVTFTGIECHNEWEITFEEIHRNGAMAHAIYNYVNYTGDKEYLKEFGIDVLISLSRFWASRVHYNSRKNQYMIHGVTGPNEYENNINNNWYTNKIATWTLKYTLEVIDYLKKENLSDKIDKLNIKDNELDKFKDIIDNMYYPYDKELDVFVQHDTFLDKELIKVKDLDPKHLPLNQKWSWDKILRSCFIKQADVLQGFYFFNEEFSYEQKKKNFEFYEPMTVHESSLSPCVHSILAAELKMEEKALEMYHRTARLDLDNYNNDTEDGLHITSMTGSWLAIVHGFAGMRTYNEELKFAPFMPKEWDSYSFKINYRNRLLKISIDKENILIKLEKGEKLKLKIYDESFELDNEIKTKLQ